MLQPRLQFHLLGLAEQRSVLVVEFSSTDLDTPLPVDAHVVNRRRLPSDLAQRYLDIEHDLDECPVEVGRLRSMSRWYGDRLW